MLEMNSEGKLMFLEKRKRAIKAALKIRELNQKEIALELKMTPSYVTRLINGTRYSRKFDLSIYNTFFKELGNLIFTSF